MWQTGIQAVKERDYSVLVLNNGGNEVRINNFARIHG